MLNGHLKFQLYPDFLKFQKTWENLDTVWIFKVQQAFFKNISYQYSSAHTAGYSGLFSKSTNGEKVGRITGLGDDIKYFLNMF